MSAEAPGVVARYKRKTIDWIWIGAGFVALLVLIGVSGGFSVETLILSGALLGLMVVVTAAVAVRGYFKFVDAVELTRGGTLDLISASRARTPLLVADLIRVSGWTNTSSGNRPSPRARHGVAFVFNLNGEEQEKRVGIVCPSEEQMQALVRAVEAARPGSYAQDYWAWVRGQE